MIRIYPAVTDTELEAWRQVRLAILPNERTLTVEELRAKQAPERLLLLAEFDGTVCGTGYADRSDFGGERGSLGPRVLPSARRRGVGTALLYALAEHLVARGFTTAGASLDDQESLAFAERFGFREVDRQVEQVRVVGDEAPARVPDGVEIVAVAESPELWRAAYDVVARQAFEDFALDAPLDIPLEVWEQEWMTAPAATFVALAGDEVIGCAGLQPDADRPDVAENALTAVRRDWRRRGVASALKRTTLAWAGANGIREVYTWTQRGNDDMRRLNEHLGYVYRDVSISVRAPLPLPREGATVGSAVPVSG